MPGVLDSFRLDGRVACVSGTTRGIGRGAAIALAEAGSDIVHLDRRDPVETRAEIARLGRRSALVELDLACVLALSRAAGRIFVEQRSGAIVNVASLLSLQGGILVSSYAIAKHGVLGLTRALANEWAPHGVRVNALAPGYIATDFNEALRDDPARYQEMLDRIPAGRWGTPDDLAGALVFLCSPASAYLTGQTVAVDGGWLSR